MYLNQTKRCQITLKLPDPIFLPRLENILNFRLQKQATIDDVIHM